MASTEKITRKGQLTTDQRYILRCVHGGLGKLSQLSDSGLALARRLESLGLVVHRGDEYRLTEHGAKLSARWFGGK